MWFRNLNYFAGKKGFLPGSLCVEQGVIVKIVQESKTGKDVPDVAIPDAAIPNVTIPDAVIPDTAVPNAAISDAVIPDTAVPDAAIPDAAIPDTAIPNAAILDAAILDAAILPAAKMESCANTLDRMSPDSESIDLHGAFVIPGLIDIHVHGAAGEDFSDGCEEGLSRMAAYLARNGITGFLPTSMTLPQEQLMKAFRTAVQVSKEDAEGQARILGIHMEGPYLSEEKCGAQNSSWLRLPDIREFQMLQDAAQGMIRIVDAAPELAGATAFAAQISRSCRVSAAHTSAEYEQAKAFFEAGARHLTHLYNGMSPFHHRHPGVIGAACERSDVTAELISDGFHSHPSAVRMAFRMFSEKICLVSDALRCCGIPEGAFETAGQTAWLKDGVARLASGTIAGAASNLYEDLRNAIAFGVPVVQAIQAATINPARAIGWDDRIGSIEEGKFADFLICDEDLGLKQVVLRGRQI